MNQAVGRVIRHRHDYGAIIFCDERLFCLERNLLLGAFTKMQAYVMLIAKELATALKSGHLFVGSMHVLSERPCLANI